MQERINSAEETCKPCPFCGEFDLYAEESRLPEPFDDGESIIFVDCYGCSATGPSAANAEMAIARWNECACSDPVETAE